MSRTDRPIHPPILHLNTARTWRGGESQTLLLCRGLIKRGYESAICCPRASPLESAARDEGIEVINLPLLGEWDLLSAIRLAGIIRGRKIGILHLQTAHAHAIGVLASPFAPACRVVLATSPEADTKPRKNSPDSPLGACERAAKLGAITQRCQIRCRSHMQPVVNIGVAQSVWQVGGDVKEEKGGFWGLNCCNL